MRPFEFVKPDSEASAIELLGKLSPNVRILAKMDEFNEIH